MYNNKITTVCVSKSQVKPMLMEMKVVMNIKMIILWDTDEEEHILKGCSAFSSTFTSTSASPSGAATFIFYK